jgi:uncharacterized protein YneR
MKMKKIKLQINMMMIALLSMLLCSHCGSKNSYSTNVTSYAADDLDLKAVTALCSEVKSADELEQKLNDQSTLINNLDLDENGTVDYIKVTEITGEQKGFSLTVEVPSEQGVEEQEIATIQYELAEGNHSVQTHGNHHIYGHGHYYYGRPNIAVLPIFDYFRRDHSPHRSNFGYTSQPSNFTPKTPLPTESYTSIHKSAGNTNGYGSNIILNSASSMPQEIKSPNADKAASRIKSPLKSPNTAQKSFQNTTPSKNVRYGGSSSSSSSRRSGSFFGGGK